jgi:predicted aldo/keto reductase-like oxidoreductase
MGYLPISFNHLKTQNRVLLGIFILNGRNNHFFNIIVYLYLIFNKYCSLLIIFCFCQYTVGDEKNLSIQEAAARLHLGIFTSIPLFQGRLLRANIPDYGGLNDQVAKLIQVIRSSPSVIAPLIGQKKLEHVEQNLIIADIPQMDEAQYKEAIQILLKGK